MKNFDKFEEILHYICLDQEPGKKMVQKLLYLMERKGIKLNLNYAIHFYGPYSSALDDALHALEAQGVINITVDHLTHRIRPVSENKFPQVLSPEEKEKVFDILNHFGKKSASELEALTTLDYVAHTLLEDNGDSEQIIRDVLKIKSKKFTADYLRQELEILKGHGYIIR